jgi:hypothetical protein
MQRLASVYFDIPALRSAPKADQFWIVPPMEPAPGQRQNRWILIPSFRGSNPGAPASQRGLCAVVSGLVRLNFLP